jgi:3-phosphoshikimate 1-carboxyvinyltransferase
MGADIKVMNSKRIDGEDVSDLKIFSSRLHGIELSGDVIPRIIDEIPVIAVAASMADGKTIVRDAGELRFKETDRIKAACINLKRMGANVDEKKDGLVIDGPVRLKGSILESFKDHRISMAFAVAACTARGNSTITDSEWADISFPGFYNTLHRIREIRYNE